ncbi:MAG TPA: Uma2 family endonuclease [Nostocaceae cyanobacterium]|nr:Uma2 family endonuclease [Nostocaceae cyanobacterium]
MQSTELNLQLRLWTVEDYHRMAEVGIFKPDERVELLEGIILTINAKGIAHSSALGRTNHLLNNKLRNQAWVDVKNPVTLNEISQPEPDIAVLKIDPLSYADHHPTPSEVYLIIEVADSSFKFDTEVKAKAYSQAGIKDYWILDVINRQLWIFRNPTAEGYQNIVSFPENEIVSPLEFPDLQILISDILPLPVAERG